MYSRQLRTFVYDILEAQRWHPVHKSHDNFANEANDNHIKGKFANWGFNATCFFIVSCIIETAQQKPQDVISKRKNTSKHKVPEVFRLCVLGIGQNLNRYRANCKVYKICFVLANEDRDNQKDKSHYESCTWPARYSIALSDDILFHILSNLLLFFRRCAKTRKGIYKHKITLLQCLILSCCF